MGSIQWVYANGCNWVTLDANSQRHIEALWTKNSSDWIACQTFPAAAVYVDVSQMALYCNGYSYAIARRRS